MARKSETDLSRYDWANAERGKYVARAKRSVALVTIDRDLFDVFGSDEAVNDALRVLARLQKASPKRGRTRKTRAA